MAASESAILEFLNDLETEEGRARLQEKVQQWQRNTPGFFTPYKSGADFGLSVAAPVIAPVVFGTFSAILASVAVVSTAASISSLFIAGAAALACNDDLTDNALTVAAFAGILAAITPIFAALSALAAAFFLVTTSISLVTRTGATIVNGIGSLVNSAPASEELQSVPEAEGMAFNM